MRGRNLRGRVGGALGSIPALLPSSRARILFYLGFGPAIRLAAGSSLPSEAETRSSGGGLLAGDHQAVNPRPGTPVGLARPHSRAEGQRSLAARSELVVSPERTVATKRRYACSASSGPLTIQPGKGERAARVSSRLIAPWTEHQIR